MRIDFPGRETGHLGNLICQLFQMGTSTLSLLVTSNAGLRVGVSWRRCWDDNCSGLLWRAMLGQAPSYLFL